MDQIRRIFESITEYYETPIRIGSRCEGNVYYRVEDLSPDDIELCAQYIAERILKVCHPNLPQLLINLPGSFSGLAAVLAKELAPPGEDLEIITLDQATSGNGRGNRLRSLNSVLVNDVITTARSCLEAHTRITVLGIPVLCWAALIDRTFGPGPVPVVAALAGAPVRLLENLP